MENEREFQKIGQNLSTVDCGETQPVEQGPAYEENPEKDDLCSKNKKLQEGSAAKAVFNDLVPLNPIHGAVDFRPEGIILGFRIMVEGIDEPEEKRIYVLKDEQSVRLQVSGNAVLLGDVKHFLDEMALPPLLQDRWSFEGMNALIKEPEEPEDLFSLLKSFLTEYLDFQIPAHYGILAAWALGSYFAHLFPAFPFLCFLGPKESGKSKLLEALQQICFNANKAKNISEAALGDMMDGQRGTLLLDQAESLPKNLVGTLADSYRRAGGKRRIVKMSRGKRSVLEFSTYGPKAFATTKDLDPDLLDRCCQIPMLRTLKPLPDIQGWEPEWLWIRDACYRFVLLRWRAVARAYSEITSTGTRQGELWRPLKAILIALNASKDEIRAIEKAFQEGTSRTKNELDEREGALFYVLVKKAEMSKKATFEITAQDILADMRELIDKEDKISPQWIGNTISRFSLANDVKKRTRRKLTHYSFTKARIQDIFMRYVREDSWHESDTAENDCQSDSDDSQPSSEQISEQAVEEQSRCSLPENSGMCEDLNAMVASSSQN